MQHASAEEAVCRRPKYLHRLILDTNSSTSALRRVALSIWTRYARCHDDASEVGFGGTLDVPTFSATRIFQLI